MSIEPGSLSKTRDQLGRAGPGCLAHGTSTTQPITSFLKKKKKPTILKSIKYNSRYAHRQVNDRAICLLVMDFPHCPQFTSPTRHRNLFLPTNLSPSNSLLSCFETLIAFFISSLLIFLDCFSLQLSRPSKLRIHLLQKWLTRRRSLQRMRTEEGHSRKRKPKSAPAQPPYFN